MKLTLFSNRRRAAGILIMECLVYIGVFAVLMGIGVAAFYLCWNHADALINATDDIGSTLHAGEHWRADVRHATGKITLEQSPTGELVRIPAGGRDIVYRSVAGQVYREIPALHYSQLLLPQVKTSQMNAEERGTVTAWRWELELAPRRAETHLPLLFTFEAAGSKP